VQRIAYAGTEKGRVEHPSQIGFAFEFQGARLFAVFEGSVLWISVAVSNSV